MIRCLVSKNNDLCLIMGEESKNPSNIWKGRDTERYTSVGGKRERTWKEWQAQMKIIKSKENKVKIYTEILERRM